MHAPENSLAAFRLALEQGADAIEMDVRLTADERLVIFHDPFLHRITGRKGQVRKTSSAVLSGLDVGQAYDNAFAGEKIPLLQVVLQEIGPHIPLNLEFKTNLRDSKLVIHLFRDLLQKQKIPLDHLLISSFNPLLLWECHRQLPELDLGLIIHRSTYKIWKASQLLKIVPLQSLHVPHHDITEHLIRETKHVGLKLLAYTVNSPQDFRTLTEQSIDGFFTDDPALAKRILYPPPEK